MRYKYDFHLHSCLSPCGEADMTPNNIVNMAKLLELDIIALTDHNTCGNCKSAVEAGKAVGIPVIPGMELCTAEEIHIVCLFPDLQSAEGFASEVNKFLPPIKNKPDIFGEQIYMDAEDNVLGQEDILLVAASGIAIDDVPALVGRFGGFCYPAHIDKPSFSVISSLGSFPSEPGFTCAEITPLADADALRSAHPALGGVRFMRSSDAHYLENMHEASDTLALSECTPEAAVAYLRGLDPGNG